MGIFQLTLFSFNVFLNLCKVIHNILGKKCLTQHSCELSPCTFFFFFFFKLGVYIIVIYTLSQLSTSIPRILSAFGAEKIQAYKIPCGNHIKSQKRRKSKLSTRVAGCINKLTASQGNWCLSYRHLLTAYGKPTASFLASEKRMR